MKRTGATNAELKALIQGLKKKSHEHEVRIWRRIAEDLARPSRQRRIVNLYKLNKYTKENETVVVPGKVLAVGELDHNLVVAAYTFSGTALEKINKIGKAISITELMQESPKGKRIRIIG